MKLKKFRLLLIIGIVCVLMLLVFSGCGGNSGNVGGDNSAAEQDTYPLNTDVTLTYWIQNSTPIGSFTDKSQFPWYQEWQKRTGVNVDFIFPTIGQEQQQYNILLASADLPDIVEWYWYDFPGGPDKAIEEGYIIAINDLMDKYAPNYKRVLKENSDYDKSVKTDVGSYLGFNQMVEPEYKEQMLSTSGFLMRKDWLDELGLEIPETIDEWYHVLKEFKDKKGAEAPLAASANAASSVGNNHLYRGMVSAFGTSADFYNDNGVVKYGRVEPEFKNFVETMRKWYAEDLLDKNCASLDTKMLDYEVTSDKAGATFGWIGSHMGTWMKAGKERNEKFDLVAVPYPVLNKGEKAKFTSMGLPVTGYCAAISAKSKHKELAVRLLDFNFSEEGRHFVNFGVAGLAHNMVDGYPRYTDLILNNPDSLAIAQATTLYTRANGNGPLMQDHRYLEQYYPLQQQKDANKVWANVDTPKYQMPLVSHTTDESAKLTKIMNDVKTHSDEMILKFILGKESMDKYDSYIQELNNMKIGEAIQIKQQALDRFKNR